MQPVPASRRRSLPAKVLEALAWRFGLHCTWIFRQPLGDGPSPPAPHGIDIRKATMEDLLAASGDPELDLHAAMVRGALARGSTCVAAFDGGRIVGYTWLARNDTPHVDGIWVKVPPHAAYRYKAFVRQAYRGRGIAPAMYRVAGDAARHAGCEGMLNCIEAHNAASRAAVSAAGGRPVGSIWHWHRGRTFIAFHSPGARRAGLGYYFVGKDSTEE